HILTQDRLFAFMLLPPRRFHLSAAVAGPSGQQGPRGPPSAPRHTHSRARHVHTHTDLNG
uniref:Uncharacterized protein n=1 Tax=Sinocyclocheilus rhinocerous TaxID=307959 RepID=A0A673G4M0_9TELE